MFEKVEFEKYVEARNDMGEEDNNLISEEYSTLMVPGKESPKSGMFTFFTPYQIQLFPFQPTPVFTGIMATFKDILTDIKTKNSGLGTTYKSTAIVDTPCMLDIKLHRDMVMNTPIIMSGQYYDKDDMENEYGGMIIPFIIAAVPQPIMIPSGVPIFSVSIVPYLNVGNTKPNATMMVNNKKKKKIKERVLGRPNMEQ